MKSTLPRSKGRPQLAGQGQGGLQLLAGLLVAGETGTPGAQGDLPCESLARGAQGNQARRCQGTGQQSGGSRHHGRHRGCQFRHVQHRSWFLCTQQLGNGTCQGICLPGLPAVAQLLLCCGVDGQTQQEDNLPGLDELLGSGIREALLEVTQHVQHHHQVVMGTPLRHGPKLGGLSGSHGTQEHEALVTGRAFEGAEDALGGPPATFNPPLGAAAPALRGRSARRWSPRTGVARSWDKPNAGEGGPAYAAGWSCASIQPTSTSCTPNTEPKPGSPWRSGHLATPCISALAN